MGEKPTRAELLEMLAEAVRNTQPQPPPPTPEPPPIRDAQPKQTRKVERVAKRVTKSKNAAKPNRKKGKSRKS